MHRYRTTLDCIMLGVPTATMTHQANNGGEDNGGESADVPVVDPSEENPLVLKVLDLVCFKSTSYEHSTVGSFDVNSSILILLVVTLVMVFF